MRRNAAPFLVATSALLSQSACGEDHEAASVIRTDSSGIEVVTNRGQTEARWYVADSPQLDLGAVDGGTAETFFDVADATLLRDGSVAVLNAGTAEVRLFAPDGQHIRTLGGRGEGPGEFNQPRQLLRVGDDSLAVWDPWERRLSVLDHFGHPGRVSTLPAWDISGTIVKFRSDGRVVLRMLLFSSPPGAELHTSPAQYLLVDSRAGIVDTLAQVPHSVWERIGEGWAMQHFGAWGVDAGTPNGFWAGDARTEEVRQYDDDGRLLRIIRWSGADRSINDQHVQALLEERLKKAHAAGHARIRSDFVRHSTAEQFPAYREMVGSSNGQVWIEDYPPPGDEHPITWTAFDSTGAVAAVMDMPRGVEVFEIEDDYVLGVFSDDLGVQYVRVYDVIRGNRPR